MEHDANNPHDERSRIAIVLVTWNGMQWLPYCLASLARQTFRDWRLIVVDNGSADGSAEFVEREMPHAAIIRNERNAGFAASNNQGIARAMDDWGGRLRDRHVVLLNQDVVLRPDVLESLETHAREHPDAGSWCPILHRLGLRDGRPARTDVVDSMGLAVSRSRRTVERGAGTVQAPPDSAREIFGPSAALAMYRACALAEASRERQWLDPWFFSYKEDVDLAWRLRWLGWRSWLVPEARAFHARTAKGAATDGIVRQARAHGAKRDRVNGPSYRNHLAVLAKNEPVALFARHAPMILGYELAKAAYLLLRRPGMAGAAWKDLWKARRELAGKRAAIRRSRRVTPRAMRAWIG